MIVKDFIKTNFSIHLLLIFLKILPLNHPLNKRFNCPIHQGNNQTTTSFTNNNTIHCFKCGLNYDVFNIYSHIKKTNFQQSFKELNDFYHSNEYQLLQTQIKQQSNLSITTTNSLKKIRKETDNKKLIAKNLIFRNISPIFNKITDFYHQQLFKLENKSALEYLINKRQLTLETIKYFKLGYSSSNNYYSFQLTNYLKKQKYDLEKLFEYGIIGKAISKNNKTFYYDINKNNIVIPITNYKSKTYHFYFNNFQKPELPKYLVQKNFSNSTIFDYPFHFFHNLETIIKTKTLILHEGIYDLITPIQHSIKNVAALIIISQKLTSQFIKILQKYEIKVIIILDNDETGKKQSQRIYEELTTNNIKSIIKHMNHNVKDVDELIRKYGINEYKKLISI